MDKNCIECGQKVIGRIDKKFCNDHCRTAWHNKHHGIGRAELAWEQHDHKPRWFFTDPSVVYLFVEK